jgi:hypothetical protein
LVDLDGDGRSDVLSGSWPGEIWFFRRLPDGKFAAGEQLKDRNGKPLNAGSGSSVFAVDWDGDGRLDLLLGNVLGEVYWLPNKGGKTPAFGAAQRLEAGGQVLKVNGHAAPVAADWDGDGRLDLIVGAEDGSVVWYRNIGSAGQPKLEAARPLIPKSPCGWNGDDNRQPGDWGLRVKPCVVDWDGDGRLDILLGDRCGGFQSKPSQTEQEKNEERSANDQLPSLRRKWAECFRQYRLLDGDPSSATPAARQERVRQRDLLREQLRRLKEEMVVVQEIQERYRPAYQSHGFVWLFLRKPAAKHPPGKGR